MAISDTARRILAATIDRSMSGAELAKYVEMSDWSAFANDLKNLQTSKLIDVSGDVWNVKELPYATIGILPSARGYVSELLKKTA